jgi:hypothetical protein
MEQSAINCSELMYKNIFSGKMYCKMMQDVMYLSRRSGLLRYGNVEVAPSTYSSTKCPRLERDPHSTEGYQHTI